jgi:hypothetical protein
MLQIVATLEASFIIVIFFIIDATG